MVIICRPIEDLELSEESDLLEDGGMVAESDEDDFSDIDD